MRRAASAPPPSLPKGVERVPQEYTGKIDLRWWWRAVALLALGGLTAWLGLSFWESLRNIFESPSAWRTAVGWVLFMGWIFLIASAYGTLKRTYLTPWRRQLVRDLGPDSPQLGWAKSLLLQPVGRSRAAQMKWVATVRSSGIHTWLHTDVVDRMAQLPRTEHGLEVERVATIREHPELFSTCVWLALLIFFSLMFVFERKSVSQPIYVVLYALFVATSVYRLIRRGALFTPIVAAPGWVQHGAARWTVDDSVAVISTTSRSRISITLTGPAGELGMAYSAKRDRDRNLIAFWQRWTHPHPRTEVEPEMAG